MAEQENLQLARDSMEAWSAHDPNRLAKNVDEKFVAEGDTLPGPVQGSQGLAQFMSVYVTAFPRPSLRHRAAAGRRRLRRHALGRDRDAAGHAGWHSAHEP